MSNDSFETLGVAIGLSSVSMVWIWEEGHGVSSLYSSQSEFNPLSSIHDPENYIFSSGVTEYLLIRVFFGDVRLMTVAFLTDFVNLFGQGEEVSL